MIKIKLIKLMMITKYLALIFLLVVIMRKMLFNPQILIFEI